MSEWEDAVQVRVPDKVGVTHSRTNFLDYVREMQDVNLLYEVSYEANHDGSDNGAWASYWIGPNELAALIYQPLDGA